MSLKQQATKSSDVDERLAALVTNSNAIRAIAAAVEGTLGPKGLDTMLVDKFGEVVITNDGVTILTTMEANHPAAKMLINIARAQQAEIGDGTTTATVMAGALISEGVEQVVKGVPVTRVIEGIRAGITRALELVRERAILITDMKDDALLKVAMIAGREHSDIAQLVVEAAGLTGYDKLQEKSFRLSDAIISQEGAENEVFMGLIINRERLNKHMPLKVSNARILIIDDALEPETIGDEALGTEAGFARYQELKAQFRQNLSKLIDMGVNVVLVDRGVDDYAEEVLTDAGILVVQRVSGKEIQKAAEHTGARPIKRTGLEKDIGDLKKYLGTAQEVFEDQKLEHIRIIGGNGKPIATILVGAATEEVVGERARIARDAASAIQAAVKGGIVPGGGSLELALAREVKKVRDTVRGMAVYGVDCVIEALRKPFYQIVTNAGFNPLEKIGDVTAAQVNGGRDSLALDCDTGDVADMLELGVIDPALVKLHAIKAAGEIAEAVLRIDTIIKKREDFSAKTTMENEHY